MQAVFIKYLNQYHGLICPDAEKGGGGVEL